MAVAPPSNQLPSLALSSGATPQSSGLKRRNSSVRRRWGEGTEKEHRRAMRSSVMRDHREHQRYRNEASVWQKELRRRHRIRLRLDDTGHAGFSGQLTRLSAFHCLRDAFASEDSPRIRQELELGGFGNVGMSIGSPPHTPADDAMRDWVLEEATNAGDVLLLNEATEETEPDPAQPAQTTEDLVNLVADRETVHRWLADPGTRTSMESILDILEEYGVLDDFRADGAEGVWDDDDLAGAPQAEGDEFPADADEAPTRLSEPIPPAGARSENAHTRSRHARQ